MLATDKTIIYRIYPTEAYAKLIPHITSVRIKHFSDCSYIDPVGLVQILSKPSTFPEFYVIVEWHQCLALSPIWHALNVLDPLMRSH